MKKVHSDGRGGARQRRSQERNSLLSGVHIMKASVWRKINSLMRLFSPFSTSGESSPNRAPRTKRPQPYANSYSRGNTAISIMKWPQLCMYPHAQWTGILSTDPRVYSRPSMWRERMRVRNRMRPFANNKGKLCFRACSSMVRRSELFRYSAQLEKDGGKRERESGLCSYQSGFRNNILRPP